MSGAEAIDSAAFSLFLAIELQINNPIMLLAAPLPAIIQ